MRKNITTQSVKCNPMVSAKIVPEYRKVQRKGILTSSMDGCEVFLEEVAVAEYKGEIGHFNHSVSYITDLLCNLLSLPQPGPTGLLPFDSRPFSRLLLILDPFLGCFESKLTLQVILLGLPNHSVIFFSVGKRKQVQIHLYVPSTQNSAWP